MLAYEYTSVCILSLKFHHTSFDSWPLFFDGFLLSGGFFLRLIFFFVIGFAESVFLLIQLCLLLLFSAFFFFNVYFFFFSCFSTFGFIVWQLLASCVVAVVSWISLILLFVSYSGFCICDLLTLISLCIFFFNFFFDTCYQVVFFLWSCFYSLFSLLSYLICFNFSDISWLSALTSFCCLSCLFTSFYVIFSCLLFLRESSFYSLRLFCNSDVLFFYIFFFIFIDFWV